MAKMGVFLLTFLLQLFVTDALHVFDAYRLVQFDRNGQTFGSRRKVVNHLATALPINDAELADDVVEVDGSGASSSNPDDEGDVLSAVEDGDEDDEEDEAFDSNEDRDRERGRYQGEDGADEDQGQSKVRGDDKDKDLARNMVVLHIDELSIKKLSDIVDRRGASGILVVLEKDLSEVSDEKLEKWKALERFMVSRSFDIPVYFTMNDEVVEDVHTSLRAQKENTENVHDLFRMVVSGPEATPLSSVTVHNMQGWQHAAPSVGVDSDNVPTIAIIANYDTFGAVPNLSVGADQNGSGVVALLELARIFSRLYSEFRTHGPYELLFVLTGGGRMNFAGTRRWLRTVDPSVLESLEFALCLDTLGGKSDDLYLHVSKSPKTPEIRGIYDSFSDTAKKMDIPFSIIHKKINISNSVINWQHEQFSRKRLLAATLSSRSTPAPSFSQSSIFDQRESVSVDNLKRNIKFIAEVLSKQIYGFKSSEDSVLDLEVVSDALGVNSHFVEAWLDFLSKTPRHVHQMSEDTTIVDKLEKVLGEYTHDEVKTSFTLDAGYKFYVEAAAGEMSVYRVKTFTFYALLTLAVLAYLGLFHLYFVAPSNKEEWKQVLTCGRDFSGGKKRR